MRGRHSLCFCRAMTGSGGLLIGGADVVGKPKSWREFRAIAAARPRRSADDMIVVSACD